MSECTGLFPHSLDPKNCSICRAAATQEDLLKMEKEANVDFLFADVQELANYLDAPVKIERKRVQKITTRNMYWWEKLWWRIKNLLTMKQ